MWHLKPISDDTLAWYRNLFLTPIFNDIQNHRNLCHKIKKLLDVDTVEKLLLGTPSDLYALADDLEQQIKRWNLWRTSKDQLFRIFDYNGRISGNGKLSYELADRIGTHTCVYCNRIYTITAYNDENNVGVDDARRVVRPDFDHWQSKAEHPLTSMSIYNLIPSCPICNRSIKHTKEFVRGEHIHPYESATEPTFKFQYAAKEDGKWSITLHGGTDMEKATARFLETEALYRCHEDKEVKDILDFISKNSPKYLEELYVKVLGSDGGRITPTEAYRVMFGSESISYKYLERPLSKLKHDIIIQAFSSVGIDPALLGLGE